MNTMKKSKLWVISENERIFISRSVGGKGTRKIMWSNQGRKGKTYKVTASGKRTVKTLQPKGKAEEAAKETGDDRKRTGKAPIAGKDRHRIGIV